MNKIKNLSISEPIIQVKGTQTMNGSWVHTTNFNDSITLQDDLKAPQISSTYIESKSISGQSISAQYFYGDGSNLTGLAFENNTYSGDLDIIGDLTVTKSVSSPVISAQYFYGDGSNLTGVVAEWDGSHIGNGNITGALTVNTSITSPSISAQYFYGDGSNLTGLAFENNTYNGNLNIVGDLTVTKSVSSPVISADEIYVGDNSIHFYGGTKISSNTQGEIQIAKLKVNNELTTTSQSLSAIKRNLAINKVQIFNPDLTTLKQNVFQGENRAGWYRILEHDEFIHGQLKITLRGKDYRTTAIEFFISVENWTGNRSIITQENCLVRGPSHIILLRTARNQGVNNNKVVVDLYFSSNAIDNLNIEPGDDGSKAIFKFEFLGEFARPFNQTFSLISSKTYNAGNWFEETFYNDGLNGDIYTSFVEVLQVENTTGFKSNGVIRHAVGSMRDAGFSLLASARGGYAHGLTLASGTQFLSPASEHFHTFWSPAPRVRPGKYAWNGDRVRHNIYFSSTDTTHAYNVWQQSNSISETTQENFIGGVTPFLFRSLKILENSKYGIDTGRAITYLNALNSSNPEVYPNPTRPNGPLYQAEVDFYFNAAPSAIQADESVTVQFERGLAGISAAILPGKVVSISTEIPPGNADSKYRVRILLGGLNDVEWNPNAAGFNSADISFWNVYKSPEALPGTETISFDPENRHLLRITFNNGNPHYLSLGQVMVLQFGAPFKWSRQFGWGVRTFNCCVSKIISDTEIELTIGVKRNSSDFNILIWERQVFTNLGIGSAINIGGYNGHIKGDKVRFRSTGQLPEVRAVNNTNSISLQQKTKPFSYYASGVKINSYQLRDDVDYFLHMGADQYWMELYYTEDGARTRDLTQRVYFNESFFGDGITFMRLIDRPQGITRLPSTSQFGDNIEYFANTEEPSAGFIANVNRVYGDSGVREPLQTTLPLEYKNHWALYVGNTDPGHQQTIADVGWSLARNIYENKNNIARGVIHRATLGGLCDVPYSYQGSTAVGFNTRTHADMAHAIGYDITNKTPHSFEAGVNNDFKLHIEQNEASFVDSSNNKLVTISASGALSAAQMTLSDNISALTFTNKITSGITTTQAEYILVTLNGEQRAIQLFSYQS